MTDQLKEKLGTNVETLEKTVEEGLQWLENSRTGNISKEEILEKQKEIEKKKKLLLVYFFVVCLVLYRKKMMIIINFVLSIEFTTVLVVRI